MKTSEWITKSKSVINKYKWEGINFPSENMVEKNWEE